MSKKLMLAVAAAATLLAAPSAMADPSDPPYPTEPYLMIVRYYDTTNWLQPRQLAGWDITYCDFTTESARYPGRNLMAIEIEERSCLI
ncbi:hypothetical protein [Pseudoblastomonas halimionae]|uniref:Secreted protein n=1 Tax=Alteriqipengyuania halimionae TaxID=1926630 RepID=A0A6I4U977_9SPHN|nr:hypothetical protein [Alteriqipengyuania halimionae]MXP11072.1 hypothetical protein [Alteriqipengyuania halimionae]